MRERSFHTPSRAVAAPPASLANDSTNARELAASHMKSHQLGNSPVQS